MTADTLQRSPGLATGEHAGARAVAAQRRQRQRRAALVATALGVLVLAGALASVVFGTVTVPLGDLVPALGGEGRRSTVFVVQHLRLPRTLAAVLVGAALAVSGSIFQTVTGNPLASPDVLGVTSAAGLGAAYAILGLSTSGAWVALLAAGAAVLAAATIYALAWRGGTHGFRLILMGIGVAAMANALTSWLLTQREALEAQRALIWLTGSLNDVAVPQLVCLAVVGVAAAAVLPLLSARLDVLELGNATAASLGLPVERVRLLAIGVAVVLAAAAVAVGGPIVFIALGAPVIARRLLMAPGLVPLTSALVGAGLVLAADAIGRHLLGNQPVGVVTGVLGAPFLIYLLLRPQPTRSSR